MKSSSCSIFDKAISHMPETLISPEVTSRLRALNDRFPDAISSNGIFECPLWIEDPVTDLSYPISERGKEIIASTREGGEIDGSLFKSTAWKRIRAFCDSWIHREVYNNTAIMGLEFDLASLQKTSPVPAVFINAGVSPEKDFSSLKATGYRWITEGLECLMGKPLKKDVKNNLISGLDAIPENGRLDVAALMLSRPLDAVRILVRIPEEELSGYLSRAGFPGETCELLDIAAELSRFAGLRYSFDIAGRLSGRTGIECFLKDTGGDHREKWRRLLSHLTERSLCLPQKRDALMDWLGHTYCNPPGGEPFHIIRRICHIKVTYEKDRPLLAKAYPGFFRIPEMDLILDRLIGSPEQLQDSPCSTRTN